jgi:hypothetical protein
MVVAHVTEPDNDEAYYLPIPCTCNGIIFIIRPVLPYYKVSTLNLLFTSELFVRLGSIIYAVCMISNTLAHFVL